MPNTIERILVATDFSSAGQRAVAVAAEWAREARAQLRVVHVVPPKGWFGGVWGLDASAAETVQQHAANALRQAADAIDRDRAIELSTGVLSGAAAASIANAAREQRTDLLVVGARGERDAEGQFQLGGTSAKLLASAECPLLLVRRTRKDPVAGVVAALDLSQRSKTVLQWAHSAAAGRHLYVYHAYDVPFAARLEAYGLARSAIDVYSAQAHAKCDADVAELVTSLGESGIASRVVERGDPAILLSRYIESVRPSLVVLGRHVPGRRATTASSVGSVCRYIASSVSSDVLVV